MSKCIALGCNAEGTERPSAVWTGLMCKEHAAASIFDMLKAARHSSEPLSATEINHIYQSSRRPTLTINRRHLRTQQLLGHVLHHIGPYLAKDQVRNIANVLSDLFHTTGAYIVTDADRAAAGLPIRDHNGLTLDELVIIERQLIATMLEKLPGHQIFYEADGKPVVEKVKP